MSHSHSWLPKTSRRNRPHSSTFAYVAMRTRKSRKSKHGVMDSGSSIGVMPWASLGAGFVVHAVQEAIVLALFARNVSAFERDYRLRPVPERRYASQAARTAALSSASPRSPGSARPGLTE